MHTKGLLALNLPPKQGREQSGGIKRRRDETEKDEENLEEDEENEEDEDDEEDDVPERTKPVARRKDGSVVERVPVVCNGLRGDFLVAFSRVLCRSAFALAIHIKIHLS